MTKENLRKLIDELRVLPSETEWVEFKENRCEKNELGEYISALANYQHCALKFVSGEYMTNQSLRELFNILEKNYPTASRIIADTIGEGLIKDYGSGKKSKKYARYIPFWA